MNDALVDEDVFLLVRPAYEHELRVVQIDDLKQLADVAVALLRVVSLKQRGHLMALEEVAESGRRPAGWLRQPHAREADLMQFVEVKDLLQVARRPVENGEDQRCGIVLVVLAAGQIKLIGPQAFAGDIERGVHGLPHGELGGGDERHQLGFARLQGLASLPRGAGGNTQQVIQNSGLAPRSTS